MNNSNTALPQKVTIVTPCYNEQKVIKQFYRDLRKILDTISGIKFEVLFVNDGSVDNTLSLIRDIASNDEHVYYVSLSRNFGHQRAVSAGMSSCSEKCDAIICMDCDLQHPPSLIPQMIQQWQNGCDIVLGMRTNTEDSTGLKEHSSGFFYRIFNIASDVKITPGVADFYLLSAKIVGILNQMPEHHRFLRGMIAWAGFQKSVLHYVAPARAAGNSKYSFKQMTEMALDALFSFSVKPIRIFTRAGLIMFLAGLVYLMYVVFRWQIVGDTEPGWSSTVSLITIFGGLQLTLIGIVGEYVARVYEEVKGRPLFLIDPENTSLPETKLREPNDC
jgi:dolichol-phosphate mannosyltransferase